MDAGRWNLVQEIFLAALPLEGPEREACLARECAGDEELAAEVRSLLASAPRGDDIDAKAGTWLGGAWDEATDADLIGQRVGPYRILRQLGAGGMAVVYLAERDDDQFSRQVALKVMRPDNSDGADLLRRFLVERQILARLNHPNIAHLFDGGVLPGGRPYFVMEFVDGLSLTEACRQADHTVRQRLELFLEVCEAVEYAHRNLVVHRDLKPSNILVTAEGRPRLLDFGIARVVAEREADQIDATRRQHLRLTPEYSSPEQIRMQAVSTATDVYSLGAVLYELLTGARVFDLAEATPGEMERIICEQDPPRASDAASTAEAARQLRGDLDVILAKALQKDPARRYASVTELADDVRRHLQGQPVLARPDALSYRWGKFVGRHRLGVVAGVLLLLAILVGVGGTLWQATAAREQGRLAALERDRALAAATRAETVTRFMVRLFERADPNITAGDTLNVFDLLDDGRRRMAEELAEDPAAQAALLIAMGDAYTNLGDFAVADTLLQRAQELTLALPDHDPLAEAQILTSRALLAGNVSEHELARTLHLKALALRQQHLGRISRPVAASMTSLGTAFLYQGQPDSALWYLREAEAVRSELPATPPLERAGGLSNLASAYQAAGDFDTADSLFAVTATMIRENAPPGHPSLAALLNNWGILDYYREDYPAARDHLAEARDIYVATLGADHPNALNAAGSLEVVLKKLE
jgi:serine/threonine-protein kinase